MENVDCALCGGARFWTIRTHGFQFRGEKGVICTGCRLVFLRPRQSAAEAEKFYGSSEYRTLYDGAATAGERKVAKDLEFANRRTQLLGEIWPEGRGSVLEIGSGTGEFLRLLTRRGWNATGIEPSPELRTRSLQLGLEVEGGFFSAAALRGRTFDLTCLFHVLEHVHDPLSFLKDVRASLKPGGRLFIEVPDLLRPYGSYDDFFQNAHLYYFSPATLTAFLQKTGFAVRWLGHQGPYLCALAEPSVSTATPDAPRDSLAAVAIALGSHWAKDKILRLRTSTLRPVADFVLGKAVADRLRQRVLG